jgi:hypothetical protein
MFFRRPTGVLRSHCRKATGVLQLAAGLFAVVVVSGLTLDIAQLIAWGMMVGDRLDRGSISGSITDVFEKESRCSLCLAIEAAKQSETEQEPTVWIGKAPLLPIRIGTIGLPDNLCSQAHPVVEVDSWVVMKTRPLVPPPRWV